MSLTNFIVGFVVGVFAYDLLRGQIVIRSLIKAFKDIGEGLKKTREEINKKNGGEKNE